MLLMMMSGCINNNNAVVYTITYRLWTFGNAYFNIFFILMLYIALHLDCIQLHVYVALSIN